MIGLESIREEHIYWMSDSLCVYLCMCKRARDIQERVGSKIEGTVVHLLNDSYVSIRQHTSAYVSIHQHTYVSIREHT